MKTLSDQDAANADAVAKCYSGPEQSVWELVMGKQIDIGGASSTLELAQRAHVGPGMKGVELNSNNGGGMRALVRLAGVDSMIGVELTKSSTRTLWRMGSRILVMCSLYSYNLLQSFFRKTKS